MHTQGENYGQTKIIMKTAIKITTSSDLLEKKEEKKEAISYFFYFHLNQKNPNIQSMPNVFIVIVHSKYFSSRMLMIII